MPQPEEHLVRWNRRRGLLNARDLGVAALVVIGEVAE